MSSAIVGESRFYSTTKRVFDIVVASFMLLFVLPIFLCVAFLIKLDSPGPVFFRQVRVGKSGVLFSYLKFRTMVVHALEIPTGPVFRMGNDARISRVGRFLRRTAIDELPVLTNVLRGHMSIVGPRAAFPLDVQHYSPTALRRLNLRPGITGYWQVFGRQAGLADFNKMVEMDLEYENKQSLALDLSIIWLTLRMVLKRTAAY